MFLRFIEVFFRNTWHQISFWAFKNNLILRIHIIFLFFVMYFFILINYYDVSSIIFNIGFFLLLHVILLHSSCMASSTFSLFVNIILSSSCWQIRITGLHKHNIIVVFLSWRVKVASFKQVSLWLSAHIHIVYFIIPLVIIFDDF